MKKFSGLPNDESLLKLLANDQRAPIESVQPGKLPIELAHAITAPFMAMLTASGANSLRVRTDARSPSPGSRQR